MDKIIKNKNWDRKIIRAIIYLTIFVSLMLITYSALSDSNKLNVEKDN